MNRDHGVPVLQMREAWERDLLVARNSSPGPAFISLGLPEMVDPCTASRALFWVGLWISDAI